MAGLSLKCGDCGMHLRSVEEAQEHAELTSHSNFEESTEAVLNLVCSSCGKPCRSKTESDLHTKRTGHTEFVDRTLEVVKPIDLEVSKAPSATGSVEVPDAGGSESEEMVVPDVDKKLLEELESMGFSTARATRALHFSGNGGIEAAISWVVEHENDEDIDQMPLVPSSTGKPDVAKSSLTPEEVKSKAQELRERARKKKEEEEKRMEREREKESDLHTKRTGHTEFVDRTLEVVKPIDLEVSKAPSATGSVEVPDAGGSESEEMVVPDVDKKLLEELESMGFSTARATRALHFSGNGGIEAAISWVVEHENDEDIDQMPLVPSSTGKPDVAKSSLTPEEVKSKAQELRERARKKKEEEEKRMEREREKESDLHTKRTGHTEFVDRTLEVVKPIDLEVSKAPSATGSVEVPDAGGSESEEMVVPDVDKKLLEELESMGFSTARATRALHFSGNGGIEAAISWVVEHENDEDIDQMPLVPSSTGKPDVAKSSLTPEEVKSKAQELRERARKKKEEEEKRMEREREKESDLHTKRTGHTEFVDRTLEVVKPIDLEVSKAPSATGSVEVPDAGGSESEEMVVPDVDKKLREELESMGFSTARATRALHFSGNGGIEAAISWVVEHENDEDIDQMPLVPSSTGKPDVAKSSLTPEEVKSKAQELRERARKKKEEEEKRMEREREKESDLHTKRTGHTEFVDRTLEVVKPIDLEVSKAPSATGSVEVPDAGGSESEEMVVPDVDKKLLEELESMGFSTARATRALHFSGNGGIEAAISWVVEHENDEDIDQMPLVPSSTGKPDVAKSSLTPEEVKSKAQELRERARKKKEEEEKRMEREREKERIRAGKELLEAKRIEEENERKRILALRKAEKEEERRAREKIRQRLEEDKAERRRRLGLPPEDPTTAKAPTPPVEEKKPLLPVRPASKAEQMRGCLRSLKQNHKDEDARVKKAFQTLLTYVGNVAKNPNEEKFRKIRLTNPSFQERIGGLKGGIEFLELCGFDKIENDEFLFLPKERVDMAVLNSAGSELNSAIVNPFFGVL